MGVLRFMGWCFQGLGFGVYWSVVWGPGFRVQGLVGGFGGLRLRARGLGIRVQGLGFGV